MKLKNRLIYFFIFLMYIISRIFKKKKYVYTDIKGERREKLKNIKKFKIK
jgi:hypothetical protein